METEEAQEMAQMPGKRLPTAWLSRRVQKVDTIGPTNRLLHHPGGNFASPEWDTSRGRVVSDGCLLVCVSPGRDSPPANDVSEEAEEPMAVPEDLSASSTHQQNNRGDKGMSPTNAPTASQNITV